MTLLLPSGLGATRILTLKGRYVKWLIDGESFLRHLDDLKDIRLVARCVVCGGNCTAVAKATYCLVGCPHRQGKVDTTKPLDVEPLLQALGWNLYCPDCGSVATGNNAPGATTFTVVCSCTERVYQAVA